MCYYLEMAMGDGTGVTREFNLQIFCYEYKHFPLLAHNALLILDKAGYIRYTEDEEVISRLMFRLGRDELYRLHEQTEELDAIIHALLRRYSGLFCELTYIDEYALSKDTGIDYNKVYTNLKELNRLGIVQYIPRKRTNYITFTIRRVELDEIYLPKEVYAERKKQYEKRIESMIQYVTDEDLCHSQFLLAYFGERKTQKCNHCDICRGNQLSAENAMAIRNNLLQQLQNGPLSPRNIDFTGFNRKQYAEVVEQMIRNEEIGFNEDQHFILNEK